jgi:8-oxo-dGTP diphosphatase
METRIGISQKVIIFNEENKFLTLRRTDTAPYGPLTWDFPGGYVETGEDFVESIKRETKEETNLDIVNIVPFDVHGQMLENNTFWITIAYKAECGNKDVVLSYEHDQFQWLNRDEFLSLESKEKLRSFVEKLT